MFDCKCIINGIKEIIKVVRVDCYNFLIRTSDSLFDISGKRSESVKVRF